MWEKANGLIVLNKKNPWHRKIKKESQSFNMFKIWLLFGDIRDWNRHIALCWKINQSIRSSMLVRQITCMPRRISIEDAGYLRIPRLDSLFHLHEYIALSSSALTCSSVFNFLLVNHPMSMTILTRAFIEIRTYIYTCICASPYTVCIICI